MTDEMKAKRELLFSGSNALNTVCTVIILVTTVYSGVEYFIKNIDVFSD